MMIMISAFSAGNLDEDESLEGGSGLSDNWLAPQELSTNQQHMFSQQGFLPFALTTSSKDIHRKNVLRSLCHRVRLYNILLIVPVET